MTISNLIPLHLQMSKWALNDKVKEIYLQKKEKNPRLSLRLFARQIGISHGSLALIIHRQRIVGPKIRERLGQKLGIDLKSLELPSSKRNRIQFVDFDPHKGQRPLPWYFQAILEFAKIKKKKIDANQLARQLSISQSDLMGTVKDLVDQDMLEFDGANFNTKVGMGKIFLAPPVTNVTAKTYQKEILKESLVAIESVPFEKRLHNSIVFRFDSEKFSELNELTSKYLRELARLAKAHAEDADKVYCAQISCFPLIHNESTKI